MKLTSRVRYATLFLIYLSLHRDQSFIKVSEISDHQGISLKYLEQLIRPLKKAEIIESLRGIKGGHRLAKKPEEISLGQITRIFEDPGNSVKLIKNLNKHSQKQDLLIQAAWEDATRALYEKLDEISLSRLSACTHSASRR